MTPGPVAIYWSTFLPSANGGFIYMYNIYIKSEDMVSSLDIPFLDFSFSPYENSTLKDFLRLSIHLVISRAI